MKLNPNLKTGIAFDNYDRYVETVTSKNTLHDIVGIAYQDVIEPETEIGANTLNIDFESTSAADVQSAVPEKECFGVQKSVGYKRRRLYESRGLLLKPYRKKPKTLSSALYPNDDPKRHITPPTFRNVRLKDLHG